MTSTKGMNKLHRNVIDQHCITYNRNKHLYLFFPILFGPLKLLTQQVLMSKLILFMCEMEEVLKCDYGLSCFPLHIYLLHQFPRI